MINENTWTGQWGKALWEIDPEDRHSYEKRQERKNWFNQPVYLAIRKATDTSVLHKILSESDLSDPTSDSMMACRAAAYCIGNSDPQYIQIFSQLLKTKQLTPSNIDLWAEDWMVKKWLSNIILESKNDSQSSELYGELFETILEHTPSLLVHVGRSIPESENWKHPLISIVNLGDLDLLEKVLKKIPITDWFSLNGKQFEKRKIWRDKTYWHQDNPELALLVLSHAPRSTDIDFATGVGLLEQAARDHKPNILKALHEAGLAPNPRISFGLNLQHWAAYSIAEVKFDSTTRQDKPMSEEEIDAKIVSFAQTLKALKELGYDPDEKVCGVDLQGRRRTRYMPTSGLSVHTYFKRRKFSERTIAKIEEELMNTFTQKLDSEANTAKKTRGMRL